MLIFFEGVDGAGKTTIARLVAGELALPYVNMFDGHERWIGLNVLNGSLVPGLGDYAEDFAAVDFANRTRTSAVMDRSAISAEVYRRFRGEDVIPRAVWDYYWSYLVPEDMAIVHVRRHLLNCRTDRFTLIELKKLDRLFEEVIKSTGRRAYQMNNDGTIAQAVASVMSPLRAMEMNNV